MDAPRIDELAHRLFESLPAALRGVQQDLEGNFRVVLRATLGKLDLVTREEFDAQTRVLERTRTLLTALEARVAELEQPAGTPGGTSSPSRSATATPGSSGSGTAPSPTPGAPRPAAP